MAIDNNFIDELKSRVDIVDLIGRDVRLKKAGSNYKGLCPFHNEKTPSFIVSGPKQIFTCFGCGEKGDVIEYVKRRDGLSFMDAVEKICRDYNIAMPERSGSHIDYNRFYDINGLAARFYYDKMTAGVNSGYSYISGRGISDETIRRFGLGFAPDRWDSLYKFLSDKGVAEDEMLKLGLVIKGKKGCYDKFRNRVIFPIFNTQNRVIGFGGRAIGDAEPKYLNSNESEIFLKKNNLYALNFTKAHVADEDRVIVVEGYMDAISLYQSGIKNVAASLGTALTENQGRLLSRYARRVILSYDSDEAGVSAALRGIDVVRMAGCSAKVLVVTDGKDPDDFVRQRGRAAFLKLVESAVPATAFKLDMLKTGYDFSDDLQLLDYIRKCVPVLRVLGPVEQEIYIKKLSAEYNISESAIELEIKADRGDSQYDKRRAAHVDDRRRGRTTSGGEVKTELSLIALATMNSSYMDRIRKDGIEFRTDPGVRIYSAMVNAAGKDGSDGLDMREVCESLDPEAERIYLKAVDDIKIGPDDEEFYSECRSKYILNGLLEEKTELLNKLAVAEKLGNEQEVSAIADNLMQVNRQIGKVRNS